MKRYGSIEKAIERGFLSKNVLKHEETLNGNQFRGVDSIFPRTETVLFREAMFNRIRNNGMRSVAEEHNGGAGRI